MQLSVGPRTSCHTGWSSVALSAVLAKRAQNLIGVADHHEPFMVMTQAETSAFATEAQLALGLEKG